MNLSHGDLKVIEIISVIKPWVKYVDVLHLPSILHQALHKIKKF